MTSSVDPRHRRLEPVIVRRNRRPEPAHGVFETLLVWGSRPLDLADHVARLDSSVSALFGLPRPLGFEELVLERSRPFELGRLRVTVAPDASGGLAMDAQARPVEAAAVLPSWDRAVCLARFVVPGGLGAHKWADRRLLEEVEGPLQPAVPLLLDHDGTVLEASRGNVFLVRDGTILTPRTDGRILPGVTRARILALADELGLPWREGDIALAQLVEAEEVFLTGAIRGVEPVRSLDRLQEWREGEITKALARELRERWSARAARPVARAWT